MKKDPLSLRGGADLRDDEAIRPGGSSRGIEGAEGSHTTKGGLRIASPYRRSGAIRNDSSRSLSLPLYTGQIAETYDTPEFLAVLADPNAFLTGPGAEVLLGGRNTVAAVAAALDKRRPIDIVVKSFGSRGLAKLKSLVQPSKAAKAWRGARALIDAGFGTAPPIAYLERRRGGFVSESFFVAGRLAGPVEIRGLLRELPREKLEPLLAAVAGELARAHGRGLLHRDLSDGNILVESDGSAFRFCFLDTNRIRVRRRLGAASRARNLVRLGVPADLRRFFLERYAAAQGRPLRAGFWFWYRIAKGTFAGWIGLKKKLRLKTLARKMKIQ